MLVRAAGPICVLVAALGGLAWAQGTATHAKDDAAIRAVVKEYMAARDRRDAAALGALFTSDVDQLVSSGEWRRGREALVTGTLASSASTGGTRTIAVETLRYPAADVAIADGRYEITGGTGGDRRMWSTFVLTRDAGTWRIAAIRNMLPAPAAR